LDGCAETFKHIKYDCIYNHFIKLQQKELSLNSIILGAE